MQPVRRVLDEAGVSKGDLQQVTLVGGASRMPLLQSEIKKMLRRETLELTLNGDEVRGT